MNDERRPSGRVDRRGFLVASAAAAVGASVSAAAGTTTAGEDAGICGQIVGHVGVDRVDVIVAGSDDRVRIDLAPGGEVLRDGPARLSDFALGERIVAQGSPPAAGAMVATSVHVVYDTVDVSVNGRRGMVLQTDAGDIVLDGRSEARGRSRTTPPLVAKPLDGISAGDKLSVVGRREPRGGRLVGRLIGVRGDEA